MSEKEKPIFPRSANNGTGKQNLLEETKQKLEQTEIKKTSNFRQFKMIPNQFITFVPLMDHRQFRFLIIKFG